MDNILPDVIRFAIEETIAAFFTEDIGLVIGPALTKPIGTPYEPPEADVTAVIGFSGAMEGGVHLSAPLHAGIGLASAFCGEELTTLDATVRDGLGELANIVAGAVKSRISEEIYLTPPHVISGTNYAIMYTRSLNSTKCYFKTNFGPFFVEVFYKDL
ncbi:MAG: chemotaxis protein CheX [Magnetococcales bacterium]|nr:chemotaxis protein CheX [Magnetococcales bacterium]